MPEPAGMGRALGRPGREQKRWVMEFGKAKYARVLDEVAPAPELPDDAGT